MVDRGEKFRQGCFPTAITTRLTKLGPTALFLQTMHEFATAVDEQLHIHQHQETPQHLLTMPCQNIAPFIRSIAARARTTTAADRTAINHLDEIDHYAIAQVHKAMPDEDTRLLVHISSGATWTQEAKANADSTVARKCPHCSHPDHNWSHTLQCPGLAPGLRHLLPLPQDFDLTALPLNVTLAVPNAIVPHCNRTFWGDEASKFQDLPEAAQNALGLKVYTGPKFATGAATDMLIDACTANGYAQSMEQQPTCRVYRNARQIAAALRNVNTSASRLAQTEQHAVTSFQEGSVPTSPNVYIDGGLLHPAKPDWQLGTFGAWHVDRNVPNMSFSDFELAHSVLKRASGGIELAGTLADFASSSTRLEIAAGVLAMARPQPVFALTDSAASLKKANSILLAPHKPPSKPWPLYKNGDLWQEFQDLAQLRARAECPFQLMKTKGHAKQVHIDAGLSNPIDKVGNDKADSICTEAQQLYGHNISGYMNLCAARQDAHIALHIAFAKYNIAIYKADADRRSKIAALNGSLGIGPTRPVHVTGGLFYPSMQVSRRLHMYPFDHWPPNFARESQHTYMHIYIYIRSFATSSLRRHLRVKPASHGLNSSFCINCLAEPMCTVSTATPMTTSNIISRLFSTMCEL